MHLAVPHWNQTMIPSGFVRSRLLMNRNVAGAGMDIDEAAAATHGAVQAPTPDGSAYRHGVIYVDPARSCAGTQIKRSIR